MFFPFKVKDETLSSHPMKRRGFDRDGICEASYRKPRLATVCVMGTSTVKIAGPEIWQDMKKLRYICDVKE